MAVVLQNGDLVKVRHVCYTPTQIGVNVLYYRVLAAPVGAVSDFDVAASTNMARGGLYKALISTMARFRGVGVQIVIPGVSPPEQVDVTQDGVGTSGTTLAPTQSSGIITKLTAISQRYARGRIYVPFPSTDDMTAAGAPTAGYLAALLTLANDLDDVETVVVGAASVVLTPVVRSLSVAHPGTYTITTCVPRAKFGTQRRRGQYGRINVLPF